MKSCRICLKVLEEVYPVGACQRSFINNILNYEGFLEISDKHSACHECLYLLRRFHKFKERVLRAQKIIKDSNYMISIDTLKNIDRSQLDFNLSMCKALVLSVSDTNSVNSKKNHETAQVNRAVIIYKRENLENEITHNVELKLENPSPWNDGHNICDDSYYTMHQEDQISNSMDIDIKNEPYNEYSDNNSADLDNSLTKESIIETESLLVFTKVEDIEEIDPLSNPELSLDANKETSNVMNANDGNAKKRQHATASKRSLRSMLKEDITEKNIISSKRAVRDKSYREYFDTRKMHNDSDSSESESDDKRKTSDHDSDFSPVDVNDDLSTCSSGNECDEVGKKIKKIIEYPRQCTICDYEAHNAKDNWTHYQIYHPNEKYPFSLEKLLCQVCGKYVSPTAMKSSHQHEDKEHKCLQCGKTFKGRSILLDHLRVRHKQKRFGCDICGKYEYFGTKSELKMHIRAHMGIKPFKCPHCDHRVAHKGNLIPHLKGVHKIVLDDKPFPETNKIKRKKKIGQRKRSKTDSNSDMPLPTHMAPHIKGVHKNVDDTSLPNRNKKIKPKTQKRRRKNSESDSNSDVPLSVRKKLSKKTKPTK